MGFGNDIGLLFKIRAENDTKGAVNNVVSDFTTLGSKGEQVFKDLASHIGLSESAVSSLAGAIPLAGIALAGLGVAAIGVADHLFHMAEGAAEYGEQIFLATEKTGLAAETISALKVEADRTGTSLEGVTRGIGRFTIVMGQAAQGNDAAIKKLKDLHVTSTDLDTGFAQLVQRIYEIKDPVEKATLAGEAFGTRFGRDMLPLINQMHGDLPGLISEMNRLGLTMSDKDAQAAHEFTLQMDTLKAQLAAAGRTIGVELMPQFTKMSHDFSEWLVRNKGELKSWGQTFGDVMSGAVKDMSGVIQYFTAHPFLTRVILGAGVSYLEYQGQQDRFDHPSPATRDQIEGRTPTAPRPTMTPDDTPDKTDTGDDSNIEGRARRATLADRREKAAAAKRAAEQAERDRVSATRQTYQDETAFFDAEAKKRLAIAQQYADQEKKTAEDLAKFEEQLEEDKINVRLENLAKYMASLNKDIPAELKEWQAADQEKRILEIDLDTLKANNAKKDADRAKAQTKIEKDEYAKRLKSWNQFVEDKYAKQKEYDDEQDREAAERARNRQTQDESGGRGTILGGIGRGANVPSIFGANSQILTQAEVIKGAYQDMAQVAGQSIGGMIDGLAQLGLTWLETGQFSVKVALQMAAGVAISIAEQALLKGIMETAESIAAAARFDPVSASLHAAAATVFYTVAAVAGVAGIGLAIGSRFAGGGTSAGGAAQRSTANGGAPTGPNYNDPNDPVNNYRSPFQGYGQVQAVIADRANAVNGALAEELRMFREKFGAVTPGMVVMSGAGDAGGAIADSYHGHLEGNLTAGNKVRRIIGERA